MPDDDDEQSCPPSAVASVSWQQIAVASGQPLAPQEASILRPVRFRFRDEFSPLADQGDLDRLYIGTLQRVQAITQEIETYGASTKDGTKLVDLWNSYANFHNQFVPVIYFPDTPENRAGIKEIIDADHRAEAALNQGIEILHQNLVRDIVTYENHIPLVCAARSDFENNPSQTNNLRRVQQATTDAAIARNAIDYVVVIYAPNNPFDGLFDRIAIAYDKIFQCAKIDEIDRLRQEYIKYKFSVIPARSSFVPLGAPWNSGEYRVGLTSTSVQAAAQRIIANTGASITSAFRNPRKEIEPPINGKVNSRHCYGDAIDFATSNNKETFIKIAKVACGESPAWVEPARMSSINHVHVDWRPGGAVVSSYCNKPKTPRDVVAARINATDILIKWNDNTPSSLDGVKIERSTDNVTFSGIATIPARSGIQSYSDLHLPRGTYHYRLCAYNDLVGNSSYSPVQSVVLPPPESATV